MKQRSASSPRWRWYHGVGIFAGLQLASIGLGYAVKKARGRSTDRQADKDYYQSLNLPTFAPPTQAFFPAWMLNVTLEVWGLLRVLNMPKETPGRKAYLALMSAMFVEYVSFDAAYFGLRSPINCAVITDVNLLLAAAAAAVSEGQLKDHKTTASLSTLIPWLMIASATGTATALWNRDEFYDTDPAVEPPLRWLKAS